MMKIEQAKRAQKVVCGILCALPLIACSDGGGTSDPSGSSGPPATGAPHGNDGDNGHGSVTPDAGGGGKGPTTDAGGGTQDDAGKGGGPAPVCVPGLPSEVSDLESMTSQSTVSSKTPMGTRFETPATHVATSAELAFLGDASKSPDVPSSLSGMKMKAFPVTLYPSGAPTPADINQHGIGDCDGDTAMASMAYMNADFVKSIITDNHDNTYSIAMYDPHGKPFTVKVDNRFLADSGGSIQAVTGKNDVANWATVLEKAVMKYNQVYNFIDDIQGIGSEHLTPLFTGEGGSLAFDRGVLSPEQLTRVVKASLAAGKFVSGGFGDEKALGKYQAITAHGYAVFVPADSQTMVSMRNPWGVSPLASGGFDTTTDGVLNVPKASEWAKEIDLRIIDPGKACSAGVTSPYVPVATRVMGAPRITERHVPLAR